MKIVGSGAKVLDSDLLGKLAISQQSGKTISKAEVQSAIKSAVADLKDAFDTRSSTAGLTKAQTAIANTLQLAVDSGWVKAGTAKDLISAFVNDAGKGSLSATVDDLKAQIKDNRGTSSGRTSYSGRRSTTVSYSGRRSSSTSSSYSSGGSSYRSGT